MIEILSSQEHSIENLLKKKKTTTKDYTDVVTQIIERVKKDGDEALFAYSEQFDQVRLKQLQVPQEEIDLAYKKVDQAVLEVFHRAKDSIWAFHERQRQYGFMMTRDGVVMGQKILPLASVGIYVPGGTAAYPSSVLMNAIPAKIAGVKRIVLVTPPLKNGHVSPLILAAAKIAGVDEVYCVGGAQAIAALAFGSETIPKVDKIVGPGNIYVATAKRLVYGAVDIDMIAGPSDVLVIADDSANPAFVASDLLAQAEHDIHAQAILITTSKAIAQATKKEITRQLPLLSRYEIIEQSLRENGRIFLVKDKQEAISWANHIAPEHLELAVYEPFSWLDSICNAGSIFLGHHTAEVLGDYLAGPNHTLPTEGTARFYSPLSVSDFTKSSQYLYYDQPAFQQVADDAILFAKTEGLDAHANAISIRNQSIKEK